MRTCLVVGDLLVVRKIVRSILERLSFHVVEAEDGEKAIAICSCVLPEAILLDWNMPVLDGYEFIGKLLDLPGGDRPRVVFCATESQVRQKARARDAGAGRFVVEPLDRDVVAEKFREAGLLTFTVFPGLASVEGWGSSAHP